VTLISFDFTVDRRSRRATELRGQSGPVSPREYAHRISLERELARAQNCRGVFANVF